MADAASTVAETPLNDMWMATHDRMKVDLNKLGDSTGGLPGPSG